MRSHIGRTGIPPARLPASCLVVYPIRHQFCTIGPRPAKFPGLLELGSLGRRSQYRAFFTQLDLINAL